MDLGQNATIDILPPALGPSMMTVFKEARKRFNVNGTEIDGQKINPYPKS